MNFERPSVLFGRNVVLEPIHESHREPLRKAAQSDADIWRYFPGEYNGAGSRFDVWFDWSLEKDSAGAHYPLIVRRRSDNTVIGTTRFYEMSYVHRRLSLGSTWYNREARGTLINAEVRLLTISFAFEALKIRRLEMITDPRNLPSRAAMKILGAVQEGVLRSHMIYDDGRVRDSIIYSVVAEEWPQVKSRLLLKLGIDEKECA